jgi:hypothetical protein
MRQKKRTIKIQTVLITEIPHEGWQRKSSVERSGTEIAANDLTRSFYGGACPKKTFNENALKALNTLWEGL